VASAKKIVERKELLEYERSNLEEEEKTLNERKLQQTPQQTKMIATDSLIEQASETSKTTVDHAKSLFIFLGSWTIGLGLATAHLLSKAGQALIQKGIDSAKPVQLRIDAALQPFKNPKESLVKVADSILTSLGTFFEERMGLPTEEEIEEEASSLVERTSHLACRVSDSMKATANEKFVEPLTAAVLDTSNDIKEKLMTGAKQKLDEVRASMDVNVLEPLTTSLLEPSYEIKDKLVADAMGKLDEAKQKLSGCSTQVDNVVRDEPSS